jgi:putative ABC transport system ATP-binding protein
MALIEVHELHKHYASGAIAAQALNGVNLSIERGDFSVLAGRSGSGKTTLLNMIGTLDRPDDGTLVVADHDVLAMTVAERADFRLRHIGFVFQAYNLIRVLSARENVAYVLQLQGMPAKQRLAEADRLLAEVGLQGFEDRRPDQMSGGQQQRVAVARALISNPDIVLADEPTANLDSHTGEALLALMRHLNEEHGVTFLVASHDPGVIAAGRQLYRMDDGRIVSREDR